MFIMIFSFSLRFAHIFDISTLKMSFWFDFKHSANKNTVCFVLFCGFLLHLQEVLVWLTALQKELGGEVSDERMRDYIWNTLKSGRVNKHHIRKQTTLVIIMTSFSTLTHFQNNTSGDIRGPVVSTRSYS